MQTILEAIRRFLAADDTRADITTAVRVLGDVTVDGSEEELQGLEMWAYERGWVTSWKVGRLRIARR